MTEIEIRVSDMVISRMPYRSAVNTLPFIRGIMNEGYAFPDEIRNQIAQVEEGNIRKFLLEQEYIEPVNHSIPSDELVAKGKKAKELGGHHAYVKWESEEKKKKDFEDFPKKKWHIYEPVKHIINTVISLVVGAIFGYFIAHHNTQASNQQSHQSTPPTNSPLPSSKTVNRKDSL